MLALGVTGCSADGSTAEASSAVAPDPDKAASELEAGLEDHAGGDLTAAAEHYDEVLKYDPSNKYAYYNLALIDEAGGNYGLAEEKYRAALEDDEMYEPALFNLAILRTGPDPEEAVELYQRAVAANAGDAAAWLNLGLLLRASGAEGEGDRAVRRAIKLDPNLTDPAATG